MEFSSNAETLQNISYLHASGMTYWFYAVMTVFASMFNICSPNFGDDGAFLPPSSLHLATRLWQQRLMAMWFWSSCCNCKPVDKSRWPRKAYLAWLEKSATESKMLGSSVVGSLLFHHINVGVKTWHSTVIPNHQDMQSRLLFPKNTGRAIATNHAERAFPSCVETARWWRFSNSLRRDVSERCSFAKTQRWLHVWMMCSAIKRKKNTSGCHLIKTGK